MKLRKLLFLTLYFQSLRKYKIFLMAFKIIFKCKNTKYEETTKSIILKFSLVSKFYAKN